MSGVSFFLLACDDVHTTLVDIEGQSKDFSRQLQYRWWKKIRALQECYGAPRDYYGGLMYKSLLWLLPGTVLFVQHMKQIQVLEGPQVLFFGKNSSAGVISMRTADPTDHYEGYVTPGYEFGTNEGTAAPKKVE
jgi:hypothetical protein